MTSLLLLALATSPQAATPQETGPKPAALLGKMFARYAEANALSGRVNYRQVGTANGQSAELTVTTEFAILRPAQLRIVQSSSKHKQKKFVVTSDGNEFTYDVPDLEAGPNLRLSQPAVDPAGAPNVGRLLAFSRASLPDSRSPFLAVACGAVWDLKNLQGQWASLQSGGPGDVNGVACHIVKGKWRQAASQSPTGTFAAWITPEGDLLKYSTEEKLDFNDENKKPLGTATILSEWTGTVTLNPVIADGTFKVVR